MTEIAGVLLVDKPEGPTSHDVVGQLRKSAGLRRVGHAGTLDPFASGLLLVLLGYATRLSEYFLGMDKEYEATVHLGMETTSHDRDGEVVADSWGWKGLKNEDLESSLAGLRGKISQKPPAYSAKKVRGEPAHRRIRRGERVELSPVAVEIHRLELLDVELPRLRLGIRCSSGTYIRALARDLGHSLGVGAHLTELRRTALGPFPVASAAPLEDLTDPDRVRARLLAPAVALAHLPSLEVGPEEAARIRQGQFLSLPRGEIPEKTPVRVLLDGHLLAVGAREGNELKPRKVFPHG